jgi:hypothetical protein
MAITPAYSECAGIAKRTTPYRCLIILASCGLFSAEYSADRDGQQSQPSGVYAIGDGSSYIPTETLQGLPSHLIMIRFYFLLQNPPFPSEILI